MNNQSTQQQGVSMTIKCLMITGSNESPEVNDDWWSSKTLEAGREYSLQEMIDLANCSDDCAIWLYEGPQWEDLENTLGNNMKLCNGAIRYGMLFYPWDTDDIKLIREADPDAVKDDDWEEEWRREIAMEAGMLGGCNAYNDYMGY